MPTHTALVRLASAITALTCAVTVSAGPAGSGTAARSPVQDLVSPRTVPGAAQLSQDAHGVRFHTAGVADVRTGRPIRPTDRFRVGSITKTVIATVTLQLAAERKLNLDDPVSAHLPAATAALLPCPGDSDSDSDSDSRSPGCRITVRQLLTHTSGLFSYTDDRAFFRRFFGPGFTANRFATHKPDALVRTALTHPPYAAPGERYRYSNTDYLLLGMVIRQVTGRSYATEAHRRVIAPLRLTGTSFPGTRAGLPSPHGRAYTTTGATPGATTGNSRTADATDLNPSSAGAAGELVSTLPDLNRLFGALLRGTLLPAPELRQMRDTTDAYGRYGMGLFPVRLPCHRTLWGHNGEISGSYVQTLGTTDGRHLVSYRVNSDAPVDAAAERALLTAEFCPKA
ncbi:serine hydrolase domain-containing protein [Streptomyces syringium]|uniref:serine hydrolase domain-containing protein n=1 Tax=Streptomyces syringium TaxID=76729 RepID=UPI00345294F5